MCLGAGDAKYLLLSVMTLGKAAAYQQSVLRLRANYVANADVFRWLLCNGCSNLTFKLNVHSARQANGLINSEKYDEFLRRQFL
jgi:hypothetical protein